MSVGTAVPAPGRTDAAPASAERVRARLRDPAVVVVGALMVLAAVLRFYRIAHQGFWFDEGNTALEVRYSVGQMLTLLKHYESTPPLYYGVAWVWARIFGHAELGLRSLSAVSGVLVVPTAYGAAAKLISRRAGVIAAALVAFNPLLIWYSQEARAYELVVLFSAASLLAFAYVQEDPRPWWVAAWVIASACAIATEYYAVLLIVPEALWLLYVHRRRGALQAGLAALVVCCIPMLWFAISQNATGHANWIAHAPLGRRTAQIAPQFASGFTSPGYAVLEPLALALAIFALVLLVTRSSPVQRRGALLAGSLAISGLALNFVLVAVGIDDLLTRNLISLWMPAAVAVAGGFAAARARLIGHLAAVALCATGAVASIAIARDHNFQRPDWRPVARLLGVPPPTGRAILIQHYRDLLPLSLYVQGLSFLHGSARVGEFDVITFTSPSSAGFCWWGSACNLWPSAMQSSYAIPGFRIASRRQANQFTVLRMVATHGAAAVDEAAVSGVLRTTALRQDGLLLQR